MFATAGETIGPGGSGAGAALTTFPAGAGATAPGILGAALPVDGATAIWPGPCATPFAGAAVPWVAHGVVLACPCPGCVLGFGFSGVFVLWISAAGLSQRALFPASTQAIFVGVV